MTKKQIKKKDMYAAMAPATPTRPTCTTTADFGEKNLAPFPGTAREGVHTYGCTVFTLFGPLP